MAIRDYSTDPSQNLSIESVNMAEGTQPSNVNDGMRQLMADIRALIEDHEYVDLGHIGTFVTATSFTLPNDLVASYPVGRIIKVTDSAGEKIVRVESSVFQTPNTLVTVGGEPLANGISEVKLGSTLLTGNNTLAGNNTLTGENEFENRPTVDGQPVALATQTGVENDITVLTGNGDSASSGVQIDSVALRDADGEENNLCILDANGNPVDSGLSVSGFSAIQKIAEFEFNSPQATLDMVDIFDSSYDIYEIHLVYVTSGTVANNLLAVRFGNGTNFDEGGYGWYMRALVSDLLQASSASGVLSWTTVGAGTQVRGVSRLYNPSDPNTQTSLNHHGSYINASNQIPVPLDTTNQYNTNKAHTSVRLSFNSSDIAAAKIKVYGVN